jgi:hypothetical protein
VHKTPVSPMGKTPSELRRRFDGTLLQRISWAEERDFAVVGQDYRRPVDLGERQIQLSSPRWEGATPSIVLLGCPARAVQGQCRSPFITSQGSRIG